MEHVAGFKAWFSGYLNILLRDSLDFSTKVNLPGIWVSADLKTVSLIPKVAIPWCKSNFYQSAGPKRWSINFLGRCWNYDRGSLRIIKAGSQFPWTFEISSNVIVMISSSNWAISAWQSNKHPNVTHIVDDFPFDTLLTESAKLIIRESCWASMAVLDEITSNLLPILLIWPLIRRSGPRL
jgi:hypothetical protein